jgi:hypothetical protein
MKLNLCATESLHQFCGLFVAVIQNVPISESTDFCAVRVSSQKLEVVGKLNEAQPQRVPNIRHLTGTGTGCVAVDPAGQRTNPVHLVMVIGVGHIKPSGQRDIEVEFAGQYDPAEQGVIELIQSGQKKPGRQETQALELIEAFKDIVFAGQSIGVCEPDGQYVLTGHANLTEALGQKKPGEQRF